MDVWTVEKMGVVLSDIVRPAKGIGRLKVHLTSFDGFRGSRGEQHLEQHLLKESIPVTDRPSTDFSCSKVISMI